MATGNEEYIQLRRLVEKSVGRSMKTPKDFDFLSEKVYARTHALISSQTLKRFWGYLNAGDVRRSTLDLLSNFVGYTDWDAFLKCAQNGKAESSVFLMQHSIKSESLEEGDKIRILWNPDRCIVACYLGNGDFVVEESQNSKLQTEDRFTCKLFIENNSLLLTNIVRKGMAPCNYICGKDGGIRFQLVKA